MPTWTLPLPSLHFRKIAVTGVSGQLGHQLCRRLGSVAIPLSRAQLDLSDADQMHGRLKKLRPDLLINAAAYTAVDAAESDAEQCFAINSEAVATLVKVTQSLDCPIVQISTDYVFGGGTWPGRPYIETDPIAPQGVYARSKADAERIVECHPHHMIIRTCGIYGPKPPNGSGNFVNTMLQLGRQRESLRVVNDQVCCPTYVVELAEAMLHLIRIQYQGVVHVVNPQALTWCELAQEIFRVAKIRCKITPITTQEYGAIAPRPSQSALDVSRYLETDGPQLSTSRRAVQRYLATCALTGTS